MAKSGTYRTNSHVKVCVRSLRLPIKMSRKIILPNCEKIFRSSATNCVCYIVSWNGSSSNINRFSYRVPQKFCINSNISILCHYCKFSCIYIKPYFRNRLELYIYHTSTQWCGLSANLECMSKKCAARSSLQIQNAKNIAICAPSYNFVGLYLRN